MTRVKICGITRPDDAELAIELGAWALGFILWERSPRAADPAVAAGIVSRRHRQAAMVGVFVDPTLDEVAAAADYIGFSHVQLHGSVGPAFCSAVAQRTGCRIVRAFRIGSAADVKETMRFREVDYHLLDSRVEGLEGGSGESWDWDLLQSRSSRVPVILSGGLTADNVAHAIEAVRPFAVDVASGTEASPGVKDPDRMRAFFDAVASVRGERIEAG